MWRKNYLIKIITTDKKLESMDMFRARSAWKVWDYAEKWCQKKSRNEKVNFVIYDIKQIK